MKYEQLQERLMKLSHDDHFMRLYAIFFDSHPGLYLSADSFQRHRKDFIILCLDYRQDAAMFSLPALYMFCNHYSKVYLMADYLSECETINECSVLFACAPEC